MTSSTLRLKHNRMGMCFRIACMLNILLPVRAEMRKHNKIYLEVTVHMSFLTTSLMYPSHTTTHEGHYASGQRDNQVSLGHETENIRR